MKRKTKCHIGLVLLGTTVAAAGLAAYLYFDVDARESVETLFNREKAKMYVRYHLKGSDSLVNAVDKLSDVEINTLAKLADTANELKDNLGDTVTDWMDGARKVADHLSDRVQDYL